MSYTEIYAFDKDGKAYLAGEVHNSWRGAMAVWRTMEERYLPQYELHGIKTSRVISGINGEKDPARKIWELADDPEIPLHERIVMFTTFDDCLVKKENIKQVIEAFRKFEGETSLEEQAKILEKLDQNKDVIAVGWNATSVCADNWGNIGGYDEEMEENIPYTCLTGDRHFWLFDELEKGETGHETVHRDQAH